MARAGTVADCFRIPAMDPLPAIVLELKMARIPIVREDDPATPPEAQEFLKRVKGGLGEVFNAVRLLANHPEQANALIGFARSVRYHNSLTPTLTELAFTTASVVNRCHY